MKIVNTLELEKEFNRLIDVAYDKGRVEGYNQAREEGRVAKAYIIDDFIKAYLRAGNEDKEIRCNSCNTAYKYGCLECFRNRYLSEMEGK